MPTVRGYVDGRPGPAPVVDHPVYLYPAYLLTNHSCLSCIFPHPIHLRPKMPTTVFEIGATGYIGGMYYYPTTWRIITGRDLTTTSLPLGAVLADLVQAYPDIRVTALVRNPAHSAALKANNNVVDVVEGSFSDIALITSKAREADITFNTGDSDDVALTKAILAGHKLRVAEDSKSPAALVHISGVAVFADGTTDGRHDPTAKVWNVRPRCYINSPCTRRTHSPRSTDDSVGWQRGRYPLR